METITSLLIVAAGVLVRLALPILGTGILIFLLRKLDAHWKKEAQLSPVSAPKVECWKMHGCSPEEQKQCPAVTSQLPCWQIHRQPNGYLREKCISCAIFINAPAPTLKIQPRRI